MLGVLTVALVITGAPAIVSAILLIAAVRVPGEVTIAGGSPDAYQGLALGQIKVSGWKNPFQDPRGMVVSTDTLGPGPVVHSVGTDARRICVVRHPTTLDINFGDVDTLIAVQVTMGALTDPYAGEAEAAVAVNGVEIITSGASQSGDLTYSFPTSWETIPGILAERDLLITALLEDRRPLSTIQIRGVYPRPADANSSQLYYIVESTHPDAFWYEIELARWDAVAAGEAPELDEFPIRGVSDAYR